MPGHLSVIVILRIFILPCSPSLDVRFQDQLHLQVIACKDQQREVEGVHGPNVGPGSGAKSADATMLIQN